MDSITVLAISAVIRGLVHSRAISEEAVLAIMQELQEAASAQREQHFVVEAGQLSELASKIGKDARIAD